ncbi:MAG: DUF2147 domain-containing protein [Betaproteobacteria bacterium]
MKNILFTISAGLLGAGAHAQMTPVGTWHSIDDATGKPRAEIVIRDNGQGALVGKVERSLQASNAEPLCTLCTDDRKGQPKIGLEIIRDAKKSGADSVWEGGTILDPENGKVYRLRLAPQDGGKTLQVRGYIGPLFRTQVWQRVQ